MPFQRDVPHFEQSDWNLTVTRRKRQQHIWINRAKASLAQRPVRATIRVTISNPLEYSARREICNYRSRPIGQRYLRWQTSPSNRFRRAPVDEHAIDNLRIAVPQHNPKRQTVYIEPPKIAHKEMWPLVGRLVFCERKNARRLQSGVRRESNNLRS